MKVIVDVKEREAANELDDAISFPQLIILELKGLKNLIGFSFGNCGVEFPCVKELVITMCPNFEGFSPMSESDFGSKERPLFNNKVTLPMVETIRISHIRNKRILWDDELSKSAFSNLKYLGVRLCKKLKILFEANVMHKFKGLECLNVEKCDALEAIFQFEFQHEPIREAQLKYLYCRHLPKLKHVWNMDAQAVMNLHKLETLTVYNCKEVRYVLPASVAMFLPQLIKLLVGRCGKVEEIVAYEERSCTTTKFEFPHASSLRLFELPNLKWFYQGKHTISWPMLSELLAYDYGQLKLFGFNEEMRETNDALCHPLFPSIQ